MNDKEGINILPVVGGNGTDSATAMAMADKDYFGKDKLYHFSACLGIAVFETEAAIAAALAKEYGDSKDNDNHWCWWDITADMLGIIVGTGIRLLITGGKWHWY